MLLLVICSAWNTLKYICGCRSGNVDISSSTCKFFLAILFETHPTRGSSLKLGGLTLRAIMCKRFLEFECGTRTKSKNCKWASATTLLRSICSTACFCSTSICTTSILSQKCEQTTNCQLPVMQHDEDWRKQDIAESLDACRKFFRAAKLHRLSGWSCQR